MIDEEPITGSDFDLNMKFSRLLEQLFAMQRKITFLEMALRGLLEYLIMKEDLAWSDQLTTFLELLPAAEYRCNNCANERVTLPEHISNLQQLMTFEKDEYQYVVAYLDLQSAHCTPETCDEDGVPVICSKCWNIARKAYKSKK